MNRQEYTQLCEYYTDCLTRWVQKYKARHPHGAPQLASLFVHNEQLALEWWLQSANYGDANSQFNVALCHIRGKTTDTSTVEASEWFSRAAKAGMLDAHRALRMLRIYGSHAFGVLEFKIDQPGLPDLAMIARAAARANDTDLLLLCGLRRSIDQSIHKNTSPDPWVVKAASRNNPDALFSLAWWYHRVLKDYTKATSWYAKAIKMCPKAHVHYSFAMLFYELGNYKSYAGTLSIAANILHYTPARLHLGRNYISGKHIPKDTAQGILLLQSAANENCVDAMYELGRLYRLGDGTKQDLVCSMEWYKRAASGGKVAAYYWMAVLKGFHSLEGRGYLEAAARSSMAVAQGDYGTVLAQEKQFDEAKVWLKKAIDGGDKAAADTLVRLEQFLADRSLRVGTLGLQKTGNKPANKLTS